MRNFILVFLLLFTSSCAIPDSYSDPYDEPYYFNSSYGYENCYEEEPYIEYAEYCYYYSDGTCCEWYVESWYDDYGCYEEWCNWNDYCGWDYIDTYDCY